MTMKKPKLSIIWRCILYLLLKLMNFPQAMNVSFQAGTYTNGKNACALLSTVPERTCKLLLCIFSSSFPHHNDPPWKNHQPSAEDFSKLLLPKDSGSRKATWNFPEFRPINIAWPLYPLSWFLGLTLMVHLHLVSCSFSDIKYYKYLRYLGWISFCHVKTQFNHTLTPHALTAKCHKNAAVKQLSVLVPLHMNQIVFEKVVPIITIHKGLSKRKKCRKTTMPTKNIGKRWTKETINNLPILCALFGDGYMIPFKG